MAADALRQMQMVVQYLSKQCHSVLHCSMGGVTGWSADGEQAFSSMFYSFMVSAGKYLTDRHLEK